MKTLTRRSSRPSNNVMYNWIVFANLTGPLTSAIWRYCWGLGSPVQEVGHWLSGTSHNQQKRQPGWYLSNAFFLTPPSPDPDSSTTPPFAVHTYVLYSNSNTSFINIAWTRAWLASSLKEPIQQNQRGKTYLPTAGKKAQCSVCFPCTLWHFCTICVLSVLSSSCSPILGLYLSFPVRHTAVVLFYLSYSICPILAFLS